MIATTITFDRAAFGANIRGLQRATGKAMSEIVKQQAGLIARDSMKLTPPFLGKRAGGRPIADSWGVHRRVGEAAVARDVGRVFMAMQDSPLYEHPELGKYIKKYVRQRRIGAIEKITSQMGSSRPVLLAADRETHVKARSGKGRVKGGPYAMVLDRATIARYTKQAKASVGKEKSNWVPALRKLMPRYAIPKWISRHAGIGSADTSHLLDQVRPSVIISAVLKYGGNYAELRILESAIENRIRSMRIQAEAILAAQLKRYKK